MSDLEESKEDNRYYIYLALQQLPLLLLANEFSNERTIATIGEGRPLYMSENKRER